MSDMPQTSAPIYLFLDPAPQFITLSTANLAATPQVLSISAALNRAGANGIATQATASKQPTWSLTSLQGPFAWEVTPGALPSGAFTTAGISTTVPNPGRFGFTFAGASTQSLECDTIAPFFTGLEVGVTVTCVAQSTSTAGTQTIWGLGAAGTNNTLQLNLNGSALQLQNNDNGTTYTASVSAVGTGLFVCSATRYPNTIALRVWTNVGTAPSGLPTLQLNASAPVAISVPATATYSTFCIGGLNTNGSVQNAFTGTIGQLAVYGVQSGTVMADIEEVEAAMMNEIGLSRLQDLAVSAGSTIEA
jgi:hypothetical protein